MEIVGKREGKIHKRLTISELRNCKGFESYSEEQAEETINSLEKLSILFYELFRKKKQMVKRLVLLNKPTLYERYERDAA